MIGEAEMSKTIVIGKFIVLKTILVSEVFVPQLIALGDTQV